MFAKKIVEGASYLQVTAERNEVNIWKPLSRCPSVLLSEQRRQRTSICNIRWNYSNITT